MSALPPPPPPPGPAQPYGYRPAVPPRDHPRATTALVLGILSLVVCQLLGPFALVIGRRAVQEIDASGGAYTGRGMATAGWITGLVATVLLAISVTLLVVVVVFALSSSG